MTTASSYVTDDDDCYDDNADDDPDDSGNDDIDDDDDDNDEDDLRDNGRDDECDLCRRSSLMIFQQFIYVVFKHLFSLL